MDKREPTELNEEEGKLAQARLAKGLCPVCGQSVPWICTGMKAHMRAGAKQG